MSGNRYYNTQTGTFSNRDGSVQARTGDAWGAGMAKALQNSIGPLTFYDPNAVLMVAEVKPDGSWTFRPVRPTDNVGGRFDAQGRPITTSTTTPSTYAFPTLDTAQNLNAFLAANGLTGGVIVVVPAYNRLRPEYMIRFPDGSAMDLNALSVALLRGDSLSSIMAWVNAGLTNQGRGAATGFPVHRVLKPAIYNTAPQRFLMPTPVL